MGGLPYPNIGVHTILASQSLTALVHLLTVHFFVFTNKHQVSSTNNTEEKELIFEATATTSGRLTLLLAV